MNGRMYTNVMLEATDESIAVLNMTVILQKGDNLRVKSNASAIEYVVTKTIVQIQSSTDTTVLFVYVMPKL